ncbi:hypothetical protein FXO37_11934 [Capsicum annuum]|nr:hypothetical protein FXO37_11934 [Capsicum annuum]
MRGNIHIHSSSKKRKREGSAQWKKKKIRLEDEHLSFSNKIEVYVDEEDQNGYRQSDVGQTVSENVGDNPLFLPHCDKQIDVEDYGLTIWLDEAESFHAKNSVVHPYIVPTIPKMDEDYMKFFVSFPNEVKDLIIDSLKAKLEVVTVFTLYPKRTSNEHVRDSIEDAGTAARVMRGRRPSREVQSSKVHVGDQESTKGRYSKDLAVEERLLRHVLNIKNVLKDILDNIKQKEIKG